MERGREESTSDLTGKKGDKGSFVYGGHVKYSERFEEGNGEQKDKSNLIGKIEECAFWKGEGIIQNKGKG